MCTLPQDWENVKHNCQNLGGILAKIESADESQFLKTHILADAFDLFWIGLSDSLNEGEWKWTDGTELTGYTNWEGDQPNDYNNQDCGAILEGWRLRWYYGWYYYDATWFDDTCSEAKGFICEKL